MLTQELTQLSAGYLPNPEVLEPLRPLTLAPIIGPAAVGKTLCMKQIAHTHEDFGRVQGFTTRDYDPKRDGEKDEYRFLQHDKATLEKLLDQVQRGELVQFHPHSTTGYIYGSELCDYVKPYTMLGAAANSIKELRALPFAKIVEITLVTEPEEWLKRFRARTSSKDEARKRIKEGVQSLTWSLEREDMHWVVNSRGRLAQASEEIVGVVTGSREVNPVGRSVGEALLRILRAIEPA